jgi:hypothetical protein
MAQQIEERGVRIGIDCLLDCFDREADLGRHHRHPTFLTLSRDASPLVT